MTAPNLNRSKPCHFWILLPRPLWCLSHLKELTDMQLLGLNYTQVTDLGLVHLKGMTKLEVLLLDSTRVTDTGLMRLKELTSLRELHLAETEVTDAGLAELQDALPGLRIRAPDVPISADAEEPNHKDVGITRIRTGMAVRSVTTALRKRGVRVTEGHWDIAARNPKRYLRRFQVYPKFKSDDVVILDVSCDRERGIYTIDDIFWWVDFGHDAERAKGERKDDYRHVSKLDVEELTSRPAPQKSR